METINLDVDDITVLKPNSFVFDTANYCVRLGPSSLTSPTTTEQVYQLINKLTGVIETETRLLPLAISTALELNKSLLAITAEFEKVFIEAEKNEESPNKKH